MNIPWQHHLWRPAAVAWGLVPMALAVQPLWAVVCVTLMVAFGAIAIKGQSLRESLGMLKSSWVARGIVAFSAVVLVLASLGHMVWEKVGLLWCFALFVGFTFLVVREMPRQHLPLIVQVVLFSSILVPHGFVNMPLALVCAMPFAWGLLVRWHTRYQWPLWRCLLLGSILTASGVLFAEPSILMLTLSAMLLVWMLTMVRYHRLNLRSRVVWLSALLAVGVMATAWLLYAPTHTFPMQWPDEALPQMYLVALWVAMLAIGWVFVGFAKREVYGVSALCALVGVAVGLGLTGSILQYPSLMMLLWVGLMGWRLGWAPKAQGKRVQLLKGF